MEGEEKHRERERERGDNVFFFVNKTKEIIRQFLDFFFPSFLLKYIQKFEHFFSFAQFSFRITQIFSGEISSVNK